MPDNVKGARAMATNPGPHRRTAATLGWPRTRRGPSHGQTIVLFALGLVTLVAMVALLIDGGNAWAQQRASQNGADSAAEVGAVAIARAVIGQATGGPPIQATTLDAQVLAAINGAADRNGIQRFDSPGGSVAYYTDVNGDLLTSSGTTTSDPTQAARVGSGQAPACSLSSCLAGWPAGVRAVAARPFGTTFARVLGMDRFTASAAATAVAGYASATNCSASQGCALLPVTFAVRPATCTNSGDAVYGPTPWPAPAASPFDGSNESILNTCKNSPGAVGWLDFGCGTLRDQIQQPCNGSITFPLWVPAQPGNPNNVEDALNAYAGNVVGTYEPPGGGGKYDQAVWVPFFDAICHANSAPSPNVTPVPSASFPLACPNDKPGGGTNTYYRIIYFLGFILDHAYVQGNNFPECNQAPGSPLAGGNGSNGCLKGWRAIVVGPPGSITTSPGPGGSATPLRIVLIK
jgi:Flp pilus assembly protein TadG